MKARTILLTLLCAVGIVTAKANEKIYVNRAVTTHIVMPEPIRLVDISTPKIAGNQCTDNIVRIKPYHEGDSIQSGGYTENELLGTITLIGERHIAQYDVLYTEVPEQAATIYEVPYTHTQSYINPEVTMPMSEMARYAWAVYGSRRKYNQIVTRAHGMKATDSLRHRGNPREADGQEGDQGDQLADHRAVARIYAPLHEEVQKGLPQRDGASQADLPRREGVAH